VLVLAATYVLARERESFRHVACERCRGKRVAELRRTKPKLDGTTEISVI
jgi:hypothetical protein